LKISIRWFRGNLRVRIQEWRGGYTHIDVHNPLFPSEKRESIDLYGGNRHNSLWQFDLPARVGEFHSGTLTLEWDGYQARLYAVGGRFERASFMESDPARHNVFFNAPLNEGPTAEPYFRPAHRFEYLPDVYRYLHPWERYYQHLDVEKGLAWELWVEDCDLHTRSDHNGSEARRLLLAEWRENFAWNDAGKEWYQRVAKAMEDVNKTEMADMTKSYTSEPSLEEGFRVSARHDGGSMTAEFRSYRSYWDFAYSVRKWRYTRSPDDEAFLQAVAWTAEKRVEEIREGTTLWRAQVGCNRFNAVHDCVEVPMDPDRMKPPPDWWTVGQSGEGRVNPKGIPVLYAATSGKAESAIRIAISEVKPDPGAFVTVAEVRTNKSLRIVNTTTDEGKIRNILYMKEPTSPEKDLAVWRDIDRAFSLPVARSDDRSDYAPTQILAELFRKKRFDGIAYRSSFGVGHNIALFEIDAAEVVACTLYEVTRIDLRYSRRSERGLKESIEHEFIGLK
jgi:hypothetical protein